MCVCVCDGGSAWILLAFELNNYLNLLLRQFPKV